MVQEEKKRERLLVVYAIALKLAVVTTDDVIQLSCKRKLESYFELDGVIFLGCGSYFSCGINCCFVKSEG